GYFWSLFGAAPHALEGLNQLPTTTALSVFFDLDLRGLWTVLQQEMSQSGIAGLEEWSRAFPKEFAEKTGINFEALLNSLGGECGCARCPCPRRCRFRCGRRLPGPEIISISRPPTP